MFFQCKKHKYVHTNVEHSSICASSPPTSVTCVVAAWPACVTPSTTSRGFWRPCLSIASPTGPCPSGTYSRWAVFFVFFFRGSDLWVGRLRVLRYHFVFIVRNLELICVAAALSWTLSLIIVPPSKNCGYYWCSAAWMAYYINHPLYTTPSKWWLLRFSLIRSQCWLSRSRPLTLALCLTVYGEQQVKAGLYIFLVSSTSVPLVIYSASLNTREPLKGISTIRWPLCEFFIHAAHSYVCAASTFFRSFT